MPVHERLIEKFPSGVVTVPPSKSCSHRALICAALAALQGEESCLHNMGNSEDVQATMNCLQTFGVCFEREGDTVVVSLCKQGQGAATVAPSSEQQDAAAVAPDKQVQSAATGSLNTQDQRRVLDCGESGSTLRFLIPVAAQLGGTWEFVGRGRLLERPLETYEALFEASGATLCREKDSVTVQGPLCGGVYSLPGDISSQFITGLLFALPLAATDSEIHLTSPLESAGYVDLTLDMLGKFGITVKRTGDIFYIPGKQQYRGACTTVEADFSQAAFFLAAAALGQDIELALPEKSLQGDAAILDVLKAMGAEISTKDGLTRVSAERLQAVEVDARAIPDLIPPIAALCCLAEGTSHIINAARLRIKESDRLHSLAVEMHNLGASIEEGADSLTIHGKPSLQGGQADAHNDHRIAMAVAVAALGCKEPVLLTGWQSVNKSFPSFWTLFEKEVKHEHLGA